MAKNRQQSGGGSSGSSGGGGGSNQRGNKSGKGKNRGGKKNKIFEFGGSSGDEGMYSANFKYQAAENLINAQGNIDTQIANLNADAAKYVSQLETGAQKDIANTQAGATRYVADRELESNLGVENIRAKGAIDLQGIVNAGMERVEDIRGEYGIKGKKVDRSTAILGGLVSAFNF
jgi:hypothetical protein